MKNAVGLVYSNRENNNNKFYIVWIHKNIVSINWGRIGNDGNSKEYAFNDYEEAKKFADKKIKEKIKKGYWRYPIEEISWNDGKNYLEITKL